MKRTFHRHTPIACDTQYDLLEISWYYICIQPQFQLRIFFFPLNEEVLYVYWMFLNPLNRIQISLITKGRNAIFYSV